MASTPTNQPLFRDLNADDPDPEASTIESLCMNCHANGLTRILLTRIPFYKEIVVMSFACEHCGYRNNEVQSGATISERAVRITLRVTSPRDLNRRVVKSDWTSMRIVELDFEVPARSQKGEVTTVEGLIDRSIAGLEQDQVTRRVQHLEDAEQIDQFLGKLRKLKEFSQDGGFTLILEDISGNSFIENFEVASDPNCNVRYFTRTLAQDHDLGVYVEDEKSDPTNSILHPIAEGEFTLDDLQGEILQFPTNCTNCNSPCQTNMKMTNIPHFKEVVIMATTCDVCGHRTNEVKSGGGIEAKGVHIEVDVGSKEDFSRDVLKSETCDLKIPQLELEVGPHALGGRFTTIEGLLIAIKDQLNDPKRSHMFGDSQNCESKMKLEEFFRKFDAILDGKSAVTVVLDDPAGNSYIQSMKNDDQPDDRLRIEHYVRSFEQNEELGLNDIKTENY